MRLLKSKERKKVEAVVVQALGASMTKEIPCKGVFIQIGFLPNSESCRDL
jgi:thioredoxin reductase